MKRLATAVATLGLVLALNVAWTGQAEARRGYGVSGLVVGALVGGLIAHEIARHHRRRYYARSYYDYSPRIYHRPAYYSYQRSCRGWECY